MSAKMLRVIFCTLFLLFITGLALTIFTGKVNFNIDWHTASRTSTNLAPIATEYPDAVMQVYAARTYNWRGIFGVHTWFAIKDKNAKSYRVYQVIGWNLFLGLPVLSIREDIPDRKWFGNTPWLLLDLRGKDAEKVIDEVKRVALQYPYQASYSFWPGPNSNTFMAFVARNVPDLHLVLPPLAIGKDFLGGFHFFAKAPSNTGYQLSFFGVFGILIAKDEGLGVNILGFIFGINPRIWALILPAIGDIRIGKKI